MKKNIKNLETHNILISKEPYRWLKEKNSWQYKYEKHKVKSSIDKKGKYEGIDFIFQTAQEEATSSGTTGYHHSGDPNEGGKHEDMLEH